MASAFPTPSDEPEIVPGVPGTALQHEFSSSLVSVIHKITTSISIEYAEKLYEASLVPDEPVEREAADPEVFETREFYQKLAHKLRGILPQIPKWLTPYLVRMAAIDSREPQDQEGKPTAKVPNLIFFHMKARELMEVFDLLADALITYVSDMSVANRNDLHEIVYQLSRLLLEEAVSYACYCPAISDSPPAKQPPPMCGYCQFNTLAEISLTNMEPVSSAKSEGPSSKKKQPGSLNEESPIFSKEEGPISTEKDDPISLTKEGSTSSKKEEPISSTQNEPSSSTKEEPSPSSSKSDTATDAEGEQIVHPYTDCDKIPDIAAWAPILEDNPVDQDYDMTPDGTIGQLGVEALILIVDGLRMAAKIAPGNRVGCLALLALNSISASWLQVLTTEVDPEEDNDKTTSDRHFDPQQKKIPERFEKNPGLRCGVLKVGENDGGLTPSSRGWYDAFYREMKEAAPDSPDWDQKMVAYFKNAVESMKEFSESESEAGPKSNFDGSSLCNAWGLINRRLINSAVKSQNGQEQIRLGQTKDLRHPGDRWVLLWATSYNNFGVTPETFGDCRNDEATAFYGLPFSSMVLALPSIIPERSEGESGNPWTWLSDDDGNRLCDILTSHMIDGHLDRGWILTAKEALRIWKSGRYRTCTVISRKIRPYIQSQAHFGFLEKMQSIPVSEPVKDEHQEEFQKWLQAFTSQLQAPFSDNHLYVVNQRLIPIIHVAENHRTACPNQEELLFRACLEIRGLATICMLTALLEDQEEAYRITTFVDTQMAHFLPATREIQLNSYGCEISLLRYQAILLWNCPMNVGVRALKYARLFKNAPQAKNTSRPAYADCQVCQRSSSDKDA